MPVDRVRISPLVKASITDDGLVVLDVRGGLVLASNVVGARIWQLLEAEARTNEIANRIAAEFNVDRDRAARDVASFVADLSARGLVSENAC